LITWLLIAFVLFPLKSFSIISIKLFWLSIWNPENLIEDDSENENSNGGTGIDTGLLNRSLLAEFVLETLPQLALQSINNTSIGSWSVESLISTSFSIFMAISGLYKYVYWQFYKNVDIEDVPTNIDVELCGVLILGQKKPSSISQLKKNTIESTIISYNDSEIIEILVFFSNILPRLNSVHTL
jgi:hypothetical protein